MKLLQTLVLVAVFPLVTGAAVITSGTITLTGVTPFGAFDFSGPGFSASGTFVEGSWGLANVLPVGITRSAMGSVAGDEFGTGSATVDGMTFNNVNWGTPMVAPISDFFTTGPPFTIVGAGTYQSTFTFTGDLCAGPAPFPPPGMCTIVDLRGLTGSGIMTANYVPNEPGLVTFTSATYTFSAVPEPGTWMLDGLGLMLVVAPRRGLHRGT